jgi:hypothetical protein
VSADLRDPLDTVARIEEDATEKRMPGARKT